MFIVYSDILYLFAMFAVLAAAAIIGLWQYNAEPEANHIRPVVLSDDVRADILRVRGEALQRAMDAKRARKAESRKSARAGRMSVKPEGEAEARSAAGSDGLSDRPSSEGGKS